MHTSGEIELMVKPWDEVKMSKYSAVMSSGRKEQIRIVSSLSVFSINHQIPQGGQPLSHTEHISCVPLM